MFKNFCIPFLITALLVALLHPFYLKSEDIQISFVLENNSSNSETIEVFYATKIGRSFKPSYIKNKEQEKKLYYEYVIPDSRIGQFSISISGEPSSYSLSNLELKGLWAYKYKNLKDASTTNIQNIEVNNSLITFETKDKISTIEFDLSPRLLQGFDLNILIFISIVALLYLVVNKAYIYIYELNKDNKNSLSSLVFVFTFFVLLFIPLLKINPEENSTVENRRLAEYKPLFNEKNEINNDFGTNFESWLNDRFFLRSELISIYSKLMIFITQSIENDDVLPGKENWLFYKGNNSIANFQNAILYSDNELEHIAKYLNNIAIWAEKHNKEFYYIIAPDKSKVYGEFYPDKYEKFRPDSESKPMQLLQYLKEHTQVKALYLYDAMHKNKDKGLLYYKNDTHWNPFGAYYGYEEIMKNVFPKDKSLELTETIENQLLQGDITLMGNNIPDDTETFYQEFIYEKNAILEEIEVQGSQNISYYTNNMALNQQKIFVLRDSFSNSLAPYLAETFREADLLWKYNITSADLENIKQDYDAILLIQVERFVPKLLNINFPEVK